MNEIPNDCPMKDNCRVFARLSESPETPQDLQIQLLSPAVRIRSQNLALQRECERLHSGNCRAKAATVVELAKRLL